METIIERGWINEANGVNVNSIIAQRNRVRFIDYCDITENSIRIYCPGMCWDFRCYDENKTYIETPLVWRKDGMIAALPAGTKYVRLVFAHDDPTTMISNNEFAIINAGISIVPVINGSYSEMRTHPVYVYPHDCLDFTNTGMVGDLRPTEATFTEEKNGISQVVIKLPYDQYKRWKACAKGNIIKCEVPVRTPPVIDDDEFANTVPVTQ